MSPAIVSLQETHLTSATLSLLGWIVDGEFHSIHPSFSRGVSVLVHWSLEFQAYHSPMDSEGRYIFIYYYFCSLAAVNFVLVCIYIPLPFSKVVLHALLSYLCE